jgi:citrate lyase subunit beta/citryl-CoA lyase
VRVNPAGSPDQPLDVAALADTGCRRLMLAKTEGAADVDTVSGYEVVALCETARGVVNAGAIAAHPSTAALMWGAEDLVVSLGGRSSRWPDGRYRDVALHARSHVLLSAGAHGRAAIDSVVLDIPHLERLRTEAEDAAASGFAAKACIHPSQVAVVRAAFAPDPGQLAWARRVLGAAEGAAGVFAFEGGMVDEPILRQARRLVEAGEVAAG